MNLLGFLVTAILLTLMPGPDILFVITQSIRRGWRAGMVFAAGLCTGLIAHTMAVALGVAVLIRESPTAFMALKFAGAAYLIYLGVRTFLHRSQASLNLSATDGGKQKLYSRGILMNLLNPKVILFFLAFFPQFISTDGLSPTLQIFTLGALFMVQAFLVFSSVALLAGSLSERLMNSPRIAYRMCIVETIVYCGIGISILFV